MKKEFLVLVILFLLLMFFWLCIFLLSNMVEKKSPLPNSNVMSNGIKSSLFSVSHIDQNTFLAYSSAAGLLTSYSINLDNAANNAGMLDQSTTNCTFSTSSGIIYAIIGPGGTLSDFYERVIIIAECCSYSSYANRFGLIRIPTVGYIAKMHMNLLLKSDCLAHAIKNIFSQAVA